jgi:hypothetical protein
MSSFTLRRGAVALIAAALSLLAWRHRGEAATFVQAVQVKFLAAGAGAVSRDLQARGRDIVSVKDYGAVGDGTTNDTTAIQAATTAGAGRTVLFPSATYKLTAAITVSSNTRLIADGTVTLAQATAGALVFYGSAVSNIEIRGFTMTGTSSATEPTTGTSTNCGAVCFETSGGNITVEKNVISGFFNGITGTNLSNFWVRGNEISHWRLYGVLASQTSNFAVDSNVMHDNDMPTAAAWSGATTYALGDTATSGGSMYMSLQAGNLNHTPPAPPGDTWWLQIATYGVMATGNRGTVDQLRNSISFNKIYNNIVWDGIMSHDCGGLVIEGNDIRNVRIGIDLAGSGASKYTEKLVISANYIEDTSTDAWGGVSARNCGIILFGADSTVKTRNVSITGNVINGFNRYNSGSSAAGGICASNTESVAITGNQVTNTQNFGGNVGGGVIANALGNGLVISGNSIDVAAGLSAVRLNALTGDEVAVSGNVLRDADGTGTALQVASSSTITSLVATGNSTNATTPFSLSGTITNPTIDLYSGGTTNKILRSFVTPEGGTGCTVRVARALSAGLTNIDLVSVDLSATNSASVGVVVEVTAQQAGNAADTDVYRFRYAAKGGRNVAANAVWAPAVATNMTRVDTDFASAGTAITQPKLIWNSSTNTATLQFQPQTGTASYHISVTANSWRGTATCL